MPYSVNGDKYADSDFMTHQNEQITNFDFISPINPEFVSL
jgi:hypothetical protein